MDMQLRDKQAVVASIEAEGGQATMALGAFRPQAAWKP